MLSCLSAQLPICQSFKLFTYLQASSWTSSSFDNGKPYTVALGEDLGESIGVFRYYAGTADKISGRTIETSPAKLAYVLQEPLGVCGQIIPW